MFFFFLVRKLDDQMKENSFGGFIVDASGLILGDLSKRLQIAPNNSIHKHTRVVLAVPRWHIDHIRFHHDGAVPRRRRVEGRDGAVVREPVVPTDHAEADNVTLVV